MATVEDTRLSEFPWMPGPGENPIPAGGHTVFHKRIPGDSYSCFVWGGRANVWQSTAKRGQRGRHGSMVDLEFTREREGPNGFTWVYHTEKYFDEDEDAVEYIDRLKAFIDSQTINDLVRSKGSGKLSMSKFESITPSWVFLESLFRESKQYRGDNSVRLVDLQKMLDAISEKGRMRDPYTEIDPEGGAFDCEYQFDPSIWGKWF